MPQVRPRPRKTRWKLGMRAAKRSCHRRNPIQVSAPQPPPPTPPPTARSPASPVSPPPAWGILAAAIVEWRTAGQMARTHGAKAADYRAAGMTCGPPGRPFENLEELGYVLGMNPMLLAAMKPHMTLWSTVDADPTFADALVLGALR